MERKQIIGAEAVQGSDEWHNLRTKYHGASLASVVMGCSPFQTPEDLKLVEAGLKTVYYSNAMKQGNDLEDEVRQKANEHFDDMFEPQIWVNGDYMASLDGINFDGDTVVELKVSKKTYEDLEHGILPKHYQIQVLQQLLCSGAKQGYLVAMNPDTKEINVSARIVYEDAFKIELDKAWAKFNLMEVPTVLETVDMSENETWIEMSNKLKAIQNDIRIDKEREANMRDMLISLANGKKAKGNGVNLIFKKGSKRTDFKSALLKYAPDEDLSQFETVGSPSWAITVDKEK